jgi:hypothetical protein
MLIYLCETKPKAMNLQITTKEQFLIIDGLDSRIKTVEKLIQTFESVVLIAEYVKERDSLIELRTKLQSI